MGVWETLKILETDILGGKIYTGYTRLHWGHWRHVYCVYWSTGYTVNTYTEDLYIGYMETLGILDLTDYPGDPGGKLAHVQVHVRQCAY